jgi:hypothetical protein
MMRRKYLNARQAAEYVGYEPGVDAAGKPLPVSEDKQMRAFYAWVRDHKVLKKRRGRTLLFLEYDLDCAIDASTEAGNTSLEQLAELARRGIRVRDRRSSVM